MPVILSGATSGSTTVQATDAVTATITLPSATDTLVGKTTPSFTTTIGVGNATPSASGAGITFPATQSASTDANTLDDYEEGTWTPVPDGSFTYTDSVFTGSYTKIGRIVHVSARIVTTSGNVAWIVGANMTGMPFAVPATQQRAGVWANVANFNAGGIAGVQASTFTAITAQTASPDNFNFSATYEI